MIRLADRLSVIETSPTLALSAKATALKSRGLPVINMAVGEPNLETPQYVVHAAQESLARGGIRYQPPLGKEPLRVAIAAHQARRFGVTYDPKKEIIVTHGGKHALNLAMQTLVNPGDKVLTPAPYWVSYKDIVMLFGGQLVVVPTDESTGFKMTPDMLRAALSQHPETSGMILNSPSNPTGAVYTPDELRTLGHGFLGDNAVRWMLSDDIYDGLLFDGAEPASLSSVDPDFSNRTVVISGLSKSSRMTGWRAGFAAGPAHIIGAMSTLASQSTSGEPPFVQDAMTAGLNNTQAWESNLAEMVSVSDEHRRALVNGLNQIPGVSALMPQGALYVFVNVKNLLDPHTSLASSVELSNYLLEEHYLAVVPGEAFGSPGYLRFGFATDMDSIQQAVQRLKNASGVLLR